MAENKRKTNIKTKNNKTKKDSWYFDHMISKRDFIALVAVFVVFLSFFVSIYLNFRQKGILPQSSLKLPVIEEASSKDRSYESTSLNDLSVQEGMLSDVSSLCPKVDLPKNMYLRKYTVQSGDTLFTIVENQLGDISRIDEFIELNKEENPGLSRQNPNIIPGDVFYLPENDGVPTSGQIKVFRGGVSAIEGSQVDIYAGVDLYESYYITPYTKYINTGSIKPGDCLIIVYDYGTGNEIISVEVDSSNNPAL